MMPPGLLFRWTGWRVGHYGPKFAALFIENPSPVAMLIQHFVIGWVSAFPIVLLWAQWPCRTLKSIQLLGLAYGALYYLTVNAWLLPWAFKDPFPLTMGWQTVIPSLLIHLVYGWGVALGWWWMTKKLG